jgi:hypothetical protein
MTKWKRLQIAFVGKQNATQERRAILQEPEGRAKGVREPLDWRGRDLLTKPKIIVGRLRKGARTGNRAAAIVEPLADDVPTRDVAHSDSPIGRDILNNSISGRVATFAGSYRLSA